MPDTKLNLSTVNEHSDATTLVIYNSYTEKFA